MTLYCTAGPGMCMRSKLELGIIE